jgi:fucose permease
LIQGLLADSWGLRLALLLPLLCYSLIALFGWQCSRWDKH